MRAESSEGLGRARGWLARSQEAGTCLRLDPVNAGGTHPTCCPCAVSLGNVSLIWCWAVEIGVRPLCGLATRCSCPWWCLTVTHANLRASGLCGAAERRSLYTGYGCPEHSAGQFIMTKGPSPTACLSPTTGSSWVLWVVLSDRGPELSRGKPDCRPWGMQVSVCPHEPGTWWNVEHWPDARSGAKRSLALVLGAGEHWEKGLGWLRLIPSRFLLCIVFLDLYITPSSISPNAGL